MIEYIEEKYEKSGENKRSWYSAGEEYIYKPSFRMKNTPDSRNISASVFHADPMDEAINICPHSRPIRLPTLR